MVKLRGIHAGMLASGVMLLAAGCKTNRDTGAVTSKTSEGTSSAPASETMENRNLALVRVVNAVPNAGSLVVYAGDSAAFSGVEYKKATEFREIPDSRFNFKLGSPKFALPLTQPRMIGECHEQITLLDLGSQIEC